MTSLSNAASLAWEYLEQLSHCSETSDIDTEGVTRLCATPEHAKANKLLAAWMKGSGMTVRLDNAANLVGTYPSDTPGAKTLIFGSHQDTVPNGGKYDGALGVILPIALVHHLHHNNIKLPFNVDVVAFSDEEGTRFQSTLLGSKAICGNFAPAMLEATDSSCISVREALISFGCDPDSIAQDAYSREQVLGFVEVHIEQGPQLEQADLPVGIVSAITGIERHTLSIKGKAGHAGTVPMALRQDALVGAAQVVSMFDQLCKSDPDLIGVVGKIANYPNGVNVIPQQTDITLELRSPKDLLRQAARQKMLSAIDDIMSEYNLDYVHEQTYEQAAVDCSAQLSAQLAQAVKDVGIDPMHLFSGAGHDGLAISQLTDIAMLFVRCKNGTSHHPDENITRADVQSCLEVMQRFCLSLSQ